jgi:histidinol-phosphatase (PHP family)
LIATYHNHSQWSDGTAAFGQIHAHATAVGVDILGLSDHLCLYPDGTWPKWSMAPHLASDYVAEIASFRRLESLEVRIGLELDWLGPDYTGISQIAEKLPLDYRIGSVHHVAGQQFESSLTYWSEKSVEERDAVFAQYWDSVRAMAESAFCDIVAHIDLPKKLGFYPTADVGPLIEAALDAIAANHLVVELNTSGYLRPCAEAYPTLAILQKCRARDIAVTLSADGHRPERILFEFGRGLALLQQAGFTKIARFRERETWFEPLDDALTPGRKSR